MKILLLTIAILLFLSTGCVYIPGSEGGPFSGNQSPTAYIDAITPDTAAIGEKIVFQGHGTDSDGTVVAYRWRSSISGEIGTTATFDMSSLPEGSHLIYFKVQDNNGAWSSEVRANIVISADVINYPVIEQFSSMPESIIIGESSTLNWNVSNATTVTIDNGIGPVALTGTTAVSPIASTTYTITAINSLGSSTATVQVIVASAPPSAPVIAAFTASPGTVTTGGLTELNWVVTDATSISIDNGIGNVDPIGSFTASPVVTTVYTLTASNAGGTVFKTLIVTVSAPLLYTTGPLPSISEEDGAIYADGTKYAGTCAGDNPSNDARRSFLSFDITSIPVGATIVEAQLDLGGYSQDGNPTYATLGFFEVHHYQYGNYMTLDASDFNGAAKLVLGGRFPVYPSSEWRWDIKESTFGEPVIQYLVDTGQSRCQLRLQFSIPSDDDGVQDFLCFNNARLEIKYTLPD